MARKKINTREITLRIPEETVEIAEELAEFEGLPLATWCTHIVSQYCRHKGMEVSNQKASRVLERMLELMESEAFRIANQVSGGTVAPPQRSKSAPNKDKAPPSSPRKREAVTP